jgi:hypothetical protein
MVQMTPVGRVFCPGSICRAFSLSAFIQKWLGQARGRLAEATRRANEVASGLGRRFIFIIDYMQHAYELETLDLQPWVNSRLVCPKAELQTKLPAKEKCAVWQTPSGMFCAKHVLLFGGRKCFRATGQLEKRPKHAHY